MKKIALLLLIILTSASLCSCWSAQEPKDLAIVNSIVYDVDEEGNIVVLVSILNSSAVGGAGGGTSPSDNNPSIIVEGKGASFYESINNLTSKVEKSVFAAHNKVRFLSERIVSDELYFKKFLDFTARDTITDETSLLVVVRNEDIDKVYKSAIGLATHAGSFLEQVHYKKQEKSSTSVFIRTFEFIRNCYVEGKQPVMGQLQFSKSVKTPSLNPGSENEDAEYEMKSEGLAVFKDFKFVGYLYTEDTQVYNILINEAEFISFDLEKGGDTISLSSIQPKSEIKVKKEGQQVYINIKVKGNVTIHNYLTNGVNDENYYDMIQVTEKEANEYMTTTILNSVTKTMEMGSDIYGFGATLHEDNPSQWREISKIWDDYYKNAIVNVECNFIIKREGEINKPFLWEKKI